MLWFGLYYKQYTNVVLLLYWNDDFLFLYKEPPHKLTHNIKGILYSKLVSDNINILNFKECYFNLCAGSIDYYFEEYSILLIHHYTMFIFSTWFSRWRAIQHPINTNVFINFRPMYSMSISYDLII